MTDLERQNALAKELLETLKQVKTLWHSLPSEDEIDDLAKAAHSVAECLRDAGEAWDSLPDEDQIDDLAKAAQ